MKPKLKALRNIYVLFFTVIFCSANSFAQYNLSLTGYMDYDTSLSSLWGYTDDGGNEYAIVGTYVGASIVDLTDPSTPVELFTVPGTESLWREVKVWDHHAYISTEAYGDGLTIIDLSYLPDSISYTSYHGTGTNPLNRIHTLYIDENGICYLFGYNGFGGAYMLDLNADPENPAFIATYPEIYMHDGFVRNDTLWAAEINDGRIEVFDISDKTNFISLGYQHTPHATTHNCEPDITGKYLFATEETFFGNINAYDISDLSDIRLLDTYDHDYYYLIFPHNVHYLNNYLVAAHFTEGVTLVDAAKPDNLVEVGHYDTNPLNAAFPFHGVWEAYPFFNSGLIIASDVQEGLFILQPDYQRACYLEGTVKNEITGSDIFNAHIAILTTDVVD
ncbi:MAG: LVIVD repeat-containing protein, partial [Chitinophagales bacterium]